jgi:hypothetical protein
LFSFISSNLQVLFQKISGDDANANIIVTHHSKKYGHQLPPSNPLPSRFTKETFSKTDSVLIACIEFEVLSSIVFVIERIQNSKWNIFF